LNAEHNGVDEFHALFDIWLSEEEYSPAYDSAIRDWARTSQKTAHVVKRVDAKRIDLMKLMLKT